MTSGHRWAFKARLRARAYGWRGSALASKRLKEAVREIKSVAKSDRVLAAEGCVSLVERLWPALEHIDTSSGALGGAVHRTLDELIPILISAPADVKTRSAWLERRFQAVMDDGVQYLSPVEDRWGEVAVYPELMAEYAERLRPLIRRVWIEEPPGGYVTGTSICLSCLLEAGRYADLIELLACARMSGGIGIASVPRRSRGRERGMPRSPTPTAAARRNATTSAGSTASARMC